MSAVTLRVFFRKRCKIILGVLAVVYLFAIFGVWITAFVPFIGDFLFLAGLMLWYVPGVVFEWTGLFEYHEFGASPSGWLGHIVMFLFYFAIATLLSLPFGWSRERHGP